MSVEILNLNKCVGCFACSDICPMQCIDMKSNEEGFWVPDIAKEKCIDCNICTKVCPVLSQQEMIQEEKIPLNTYAAFAKNNKIRETASSGGIFPVLAEMIVEKQGIVFGAAMSSGCKSVEHINIKEATELYKLYGSKYIQSIMKGMYSEAKRLLKEGKCVLFSGTPCQIAGLKKFLCGKEYSNLFTVDIICHGIPSPELWSRYIQYLEKKKKAMVVQVNFRAKKGSCWDSNIGGSEDYNFFSFKDRNSYIQMFLNNYCLRESCYECQFKKNKMSDITLGDFWGIEHIIPEMKEDDKEVSVVIVRTEKGKRLFSAIESKIEMRQVPYDKAIQYNSAEFKSVNRPPERDCFFYDMKYLSYKQLENKYCHITKKEKLRRYLEDIGVWKFLRGEIVNEYGVLFRMRKSKKR